MYDHRRKLEWASKHLDALENSIRDFAYTAPYHLTLQFNPETRENEARIGNLKRLNPDWSLMVGDIVHSLRSSLDSIVYALAVKHSGEAQADAHTSLQFPICDTPAGFHGTLKKPQGQKRRITLLSPSAQTAIEGLQPYQRPDPQGPHHFSALRDLSNIDKHRHIILTYPNASDIRIKLIHPLILGHSDIRSGFKGTMEVGTLIARIFFFDESGRGVPLPDEVQVDPDLSLEIQLGTGKFAGPAIGVLRATHDRIRDEVFKELEPLLL